ncbi:MAG: hypothetical protein ISP86_00990 [Shewanellaceae bacterium]|nr:hypothetical protein [Shewanellaceae bacterium]
MRRNMLGVTLFELMMVLVILSIVGFGFAKLVIFASTLYQHQVTTRAVMTQAGFVGARMRDSLQFVLPDSVAVRRESDQLICLDSIALNHTGLYARWEGNSQAVAIFMPALESAQPIKWPQAVFFEGAASRKTFPYRHFSWVLQATESELVLKSPASLAPMSAMATHGRFFLATDVQSFCLIPSPKHHQKRPFADLYGCRKPVLKQKNNRPRRVKSIVNKCHLLASHIVASSSATTRGKLQSVFEVAFPPFVVEQKSNRDTQTVVLNFSFYTSSPIGDFLTRLNQRIQVGYE